MIILFWSLISLFGFSHKFFLFVVNLFKGTNNKWNFCRDQNLLIYRDQKECQKSKNKIFVLSRIKNEEFFLLRNKYKIWIFISDHKHILAKYVSFTNFPCCDHVGAAILKSEIGWFDDINNTSSMLSSRLETDATFLRTVVVDRSTILLQNVGLVVASLLCSVYLYEMLWKARK